MKTLITTSIILFAVNAFAFDMPNLTFPTESGWAKGMTEQACKVKFAKSAVGTIEDSAKGGVVYTVYNPKGQVLASAWAKNDSIFAKKQCMMK